MVGITQTPVKQPQLLFAIIMSGLIVEVKIQLDPSYAFCSVIITVYIGSFDCTDIMGQDLSFLSVLCDFDSYLCANNII